MWLHRHRFFFVGLEWGLQRQIIDEHTVGSVVLFDTGVQMIRLFDQFSPLLHLHVCPTCVCHATPIVRWVCYY